MGVFEKLIAVQGKLKAPKNQYNSFGKYNYRNAEDILEAVKPLCAEQKAVIYISDRPLFIEGRFYIEATATFRDVESDGHISVCAYAREDDTKKGMDGSQVTGAASSYARKYALNGLLCVDDGRDADSLPPDNGEKNGREKPPQPPPPSKTTKCERCGNPILAARNGKTILKTADEILEYSLKTYKMPLCINCITYYAKRNAVS